MHDEQIVLEKLKNSIPPCSAKCPGLGVEIS
jgi:hypothetical protein